MSSHAGSSMIAPASLPNEWRCQAQGAPADNDELWEVEWGSIAALREEKAKTNMHASQLYDSSAWQAPQQQQLQPLGCQPVFFIVTGVPATRTPMQACVMGNFTPGAAAYTPSLDTEAAAEKVAPVTPPGTFDSHQEENLYDGELPSVGSAEHAAGTCKRCAFFPKGRCQNGKDCTHCHFQHLPRSRLRKRGASRHGSVEIDSETVNGELEVEDIECVDCGEATVEVLSDVECVDCSEPPVEVQSEMVAKESCAIKALLDAVAKAQDPDDTTEVETTTSVSALSDNELSMVDSSSATSDSETVTPTDGSVAGAGFHKASGFGASPSSWAAQQRIRRAAKADSSPAEVGRMVRALLNKLTEERFESLASQMLALPLSTPEQLAVVTAELFEKATTEHGFRSLYTELCARLDAHLAQQSGAIGGKAFRKALVNECQATFERNLQPLAASLFSGLEGDELLEAEMNLKNRRIGNMRFIGELLVRRLLAPKLMLPIIHELLNGDEAAIEDLIALLTVVAPSFEQKTSMFQAPLKDAFVSLRQKSTCKGVSSRVGCNISDLLEARSRAWAPRAVSA